jgi:quercetin dioxygenase-like cupin family protein
MQSEAAQPHLAETRLVRRADLAACDEAFVDCRLEGSTPKFNYSIIGPGVTQADDQLVNLPEPHGFSLGAAAMPKGVTNNLHIHYTAEVFMIFKGEWLFRWGADGKEGEFVGRAGDILSMPTWIFRGFTNIGADDGWIFTALGRDETGGVIWHPDILRRAADTGLYLSKTNMLIDLAKGDPLPDRGDLLEPLSEAFIAELQHVGPDEMRSRITTAAERLWSPQALLQSVLPGHRAAIAPVIGWGMSEDRMARPKTVNPHGFSIEWLRIEAGSCVGPFRTNPKQVLIVQFGAVEITLGDGSQVTARPWDIFSVPEGEWRSLRSIGAEDALMIVMTAGDARALIEWSPATVAEARAADFGIDPNGYIAPAHSLPHDAA